MNGIIDQETRARFFSELNRNFSVIASAGSGKTRAITERIVQIAKNERALELLPKLVIVTYTNRAADEMQQRSREQIVQANLSLEVIEAFNRAFFGTIHSFCVKLLTAYGYHLGLPANLELITDDEDLWSHFVQRQAVIGRTLTPENRRVLLRHVQARQLMELARRCDFDLTAVQPDTPCPDTSFAEVYATVARGNTVRTIPRAQAELKRWESRWRDTDEFAPWPPCVSAAKDFVARWREAFAPVREWVNSCALCVAAEVQRDYREFRLERGVVTYADQIALASELMRQTEVVRKIREKDYHVILDEAQDTDPQQFFVLLEITRPVEAKTAWMREQKFPPRPGHFCMVGDFQQSIYRDPADLARYRELHERLVETKAAEELRFSVTFRLDQAQLEFVNQTFREILNNTDGQVAFLELNPRPDVLPGQVIRVKLSDEIDLNLPESRRASMEARELAEWIQAAGLARLRAESWRDVAILCPRKIWLRSLRDALLARGIPVEIQSQTDLQAENPAYAWLTALLAIMIDPHGHYEIVGVLREIFGLSDDELARFAQGYAGRFQVASPTRGRGPVEQTLTQLSHIRAAIEQQALFTAVDGIVRATQLRERLGALPREDFPGLGADLNMLLGAAAEAEAKSWSLTDFARDLRRNYGATRETSPSREDAIQLITAHGAKGSEWQVVIVPFLSRQVRMANPRYPRIIRTIEEDRPQIIFDRTDIADLEEQLKESNRQEMERLLYVALTRAKHTLVLAADHSFFATSSGDVQSDSQMRWLRAEPGGTNHAIIAGLTTQAADCTKTVTRQKATQSKKLNERFPSRQTGWFDDARRKASIFLHTIRPSQFTTEQETLEETADNWKQSEPELQPPRIGNPATRYGVWWHEFAEQVTWTSDLNSLSDFFAASQAFSPEPARSQREWNLLCEHLSNEASFRQSFQQNVVSRTEVPFFWRADSSTSLEGVIDLTLIDSARSVCLIIDWKTNRITEREIESLRQLYLPQIAAYWEAVRQMTGMQVEAGIYSTSTGRFVLYESGELAREWERLRKLPLNDLADEITEQVPAANIPARHG
jgi:ATP-dependent helicase/nuclease subunit A